MDLDLLKNHSAPAVSNRESLVLLQNKMESATHLHIVPPVNHAFISGIYSREILIPEGTLVAGRIHKGEHLSVISLGIVQVIEENLFTGEITYKTYMAPCRFTSPAGTKRMVYAVSDTVWTTFHKYEGEPVADGIEDVFTHPNRESWAAEFIQVEAL